MTGAGCTFCSIVAGDLEAAVVLRTRTVTAFLDWRPIHPGHTLVVPNHHEPNFEELSGEILQDVMAIVQSVSRAVKIVHSPKKMGVAIAGFDGPHAHVHVIPLHHYHDLTSQSLLDGTLVRATPEVLKLSAARIQEALGSRYDGAT